MKFIVADDHAVVRKGLKQILTDMSGVTLVEEVDNSPTLIERITKENFDFIEVSEMLHRYYKPSATRLRPADKMVAHTGYLIFARKILAYGQNN